MPSVTRPRHHLPTGRCRGDRCHGQGHPCRDPTNASATIMRMTLKLPESERKRQDKSVRCAERSGRTTKLMHVHGSNVPPPTANAAAANSLKQETLDPQTKSADLAVNPHATWGLSVQVLSRPTSRTKARAECASVCSGRPPSHCAPTRSEPKGGRYVRSPHL